MLHMYYDTFFQMQIFYLVQYLLNLIFENQKHQKIYHSEFFHIFEMVLYLHTTYFIFLHTPLVLYWTWKFRTSNLPNLGSSSKTKLRNSRTTQKDWTSNQILSKCITYVQETNNYCHIFKTNWSTVSHLQEGNHFYNEFDWIGISMR